MSEPRRTADSVPMVRPAPSDSTTAADTSSNVLAMAFSTKGHTSWPLRTSDVPKSPVARLPSHFR